LEGFNINILLNLVLGLIMFGLGLSLSPSDFRKLFQQPKSLAVGLFSQMVLLPLVAWVIAILAPVSPELKVGIMILSVCPGGITSNLVSYFVKGNVALAISLTVCNAFLSLFTIPILVNLFLEHFLESGQTISLPFLRTMGEIFLITIVPAALGILMHSRFKKFSQQAEKYLNYVLPVLLLLVFLFKFLGNSEQGGTGIVMDEILALSWWVILLNVLSMLFGFLVGNLFSLHFKNRITIAVEVGLHNTALALLIAGEKLGNATMEKPALVYAMFSFIITFLIAWTMMRFHKTFYKRKNRTTEITES
jgi:BASS family bile acid:Na+ symporter